MRSAAVIVANDRAGGAVLDLLDGMLLVDTPSLPTQASIWLEQQGSGNRTYEPPVTPKPLIASRHRIQLPGTIIYTCAHFLLRSETRVRAAP